MFASVQKRSPPVFDDVLVINFSLNSLNSLNSSFPENLYTLLASCRIANEKIC